MAKTNKTESPFPRYKLGKTKARPGTVPKPDEWVNPGDSVIVAPGGKIVSGPLHEEFGILYADVDLERVGMARRSLDVVGHYSRPDVFQLHVNTKALRPAEFAQPVPGSK